MPHADDKQELVDTILSEPATFVAEHFKEGGVFHSEAYGLDLADLEGLPVIMRLTVGNEIYLNVVSWWLGDTCYRRLEYQAHAKNPDSEEPLAWVRDYVKHEEYQMFWGECWELEQAAVGVATYEWREITVDNMRYTPDGRYAWFFPCGLKPAMRRDGMSMHVNNQD